MNTRGSHRDGGFSSYDALTHVKMTRALVLRRSSRCGVAFAAELISDGADTDSARVQ